MSKMWALDAMFWDVDAGSAAYIRANNRKNVVVDCGAGTSKAEFSPLQFLNSPAFGIPELDYLILSHPHHDHIEDLRTLDELGMEPQLLHRPKAARSLVEENIRDAKRKGRMDYVEDAKYYLNLDDRYTKTSSQDPSSRSWAGGVTFSNYGTYNPDLGNNTYERLNNMSIVTVVESFGFKLVTMGDLMPKGMDELFQPGTDAWNAVQDAEILVAPHHGRESSFDRDLVKHINPDLVIVSDKIDQGNNAVSQYSQLASGAFVEDEKSGNKGVRNVITTRNDGRIRIQANNDGDWKATYKEHHATNARKSHQYQKAGR